ncbi:MAG: hypothetical protein HUU34_04840 [Saprospiraceae bacterium]|nr:hypothetical protein [Saprospiraceae bacterium]
MSELEIQQFIIKALNRMSSVQQVKLLEFIDAMLAISKAEKPRDILQFAGVFDAEDVRSLKLRYWIAGK